MNLSLHRVGVRYGAIHALDGISLTVAAGQVLALLGPNGSGKSTLLRAVAGLIRHEGTIESAGVPRDAIGFMPQDTGSRAALTVLEAALLGRVRSLALRVSRDDVNVAAAMLDQLGIVHLAQRRLGELSGGQRQLAFLAQALAAEPRILLLDEPTSALDMRNQLEMLALIRRLTLARAMVTVAALHDLNAAARFADAVAVLREGRLAAHGTPGAVLNAATLAAVYGIEALVQIDEFGLPVIVPRRALAREGAP